MPRLKAVIVVLLVLAAQSGAAAQYSTPFGPVPGNRVRVQAPLLVDVPIVGQLVAFGGDSLLMRASDGHATMLLPAANVQQVEVSEGRDRLGYALKFGAAGALAGALLGGSTLGDNSLERLAGFFAGGIVGAPLGAVTGVILAPEDWRIAWRPDAVPSSTRALHLAIDEGAEVRFTLRSDTTSASRASSGGVVNDTLLLLPRGGMASRAIALRDLSRLEISGGDDKRRGMLLGAGIVGGATAIFAGSDLSKGNISAGDALSAVAGNAVIGALIGYAFAPRGWERLPLPAR